MCGDLKLALGDLGDQRGHDLILDRAGPTATRLAEETFDPIDDEAIAPFANRMRADTKPDRHHAVARPALATQRDRRPQPQCRRERARPRHRRKMGTFVTGIRDHRFWPFSSHRISFDQNTRKPMQ
jgi:hypothetical protein